MRVLDGSIALFDSVAGVEPQSETVWRQADKYNGAEDRVRQQDGPYRGGFLQGRGDYEGPAGCQRGAGSVAYRAESEFQGIVDLVEMKALVYKDDLGADWEETEIPEDMRTLAEEYREQLVEAVADQDEELMMMYLEGEEMEISQIRATIRKATLANAMTPSSAGRRSRTRVCSRFWTGS